MRFPPLQYCGRTCLFEMFGGDFQVIVPGFRRDLAEGGGHGKVMNPTQFRRASGPCIVEAVALLPYADPERQPFQAVGRQGVQRHGVPGAQGDAVGQADVQAQAGLGKRPQVMGSADPPAQLLFLQEFLAPGPRTLPGEGFRGPRNIGARSLCSARPIRTGNPRRAWRKATHRSLRRPPKRPGSCWTRCPGPNRRKSVPGKRRRRR